MFRWGLVPNWSFHHHGSQFLHVCACAVFAQVGSEFSVVIIGVPCSEVCREGTYLLDESHSYLQHLASVVGDVVYRENVLHHGNPYLSLSGRKDGQLEARCGVWSFVWHSGW